MPQTIGRRLKNMERVLKKITPALLEKLKKSSVPLNSESRKQLSPELLEKVITSKSRLLVLPYPNNPTVAIM